MILVASHPRDDHAAAVLQTLAALGHPAVLVDTADFPAQSRLTLRLGDNERHLQLATASQRLDLDTVGVVWWRRPLPFVLDPALDPSSVTFAYTESHEAMAGMWHSLRASWVNPPAADEIAHHKPYQLAVAAEVGLAIPATLVTNDPDAARAFISERAPGRTIFKSFIATEAHWRETRAVTAGELEVLDQVRLAPVIFQEFVPAAADLRVTVLGDRMFATEITTDPGAYAFDYRVNMSAASFRATTLPVEVESTLRQLLGRLGLVYGAIDLRRTSAGEHVFLEVNPAGEWRFVEERSEQPVTAAMADLLCRLDQAGPRS